MRRRGSGFALITVMLIMVVLAALGVGASFLTNVNLRIAENTRAQSQARFNASQGIDTALVLLAATFNSENELPGDDAAFASLFPDFDNADFQLLSYRTLGADDGVADSVDTAEIRVIGFGARGAEFVSEALIEGAGTRMQQGPTSSPFDDDWACNSDGVFAGNPDIYLNVFCGGDLLVSPGRFHDGMSGRAVGRCEARNSPCIQVEEGPDVPAPVFEDLRDQVIDSVGGLGACTWTTALSISASNQVICLTEGQELTVTGNVQNLTIIGDESTTVTLSGVTTGVAADPSVNGITVVSGQVNIPAGTTFNGTNTIIAKEELEFIGNQVLGRSNDALSLFISEKSITMRGTGASDMVAAFWTGEDMIIKGTPGNFRSAVLAAGSIDVSGTGVARIRPVDAVDNPFKPVDQEPTFANAGIRLLARR